MDTKFELITTPDAFQKINGIVGYVIRSNGKWSACTKIEPILTSSKYRLPNGDIICNAQTIQPGWKRIESLQYITHFGSNLTKTVEKERTLHLSNDAFKTLVSNANEYLKIESPSPKPGS